MVQPMQVTLWQQAARGGDTEGWRAIKSIHTAVPPTALAWGCKGYDRHAMLLLVLLVLLLLVLALLLTDKPV